MYLKIDHAAMASLEDIIWSFIQMVRPGAGEMMSLSVLSVLYTESLLSAVTFSHLEPVLSSLESPS